GPVEIERKFLVASDEWRLSAVGSVRIRDGLIAAYEGRKVRIRISGDIATVAIKGPRTGIARPELPHPPTPPAALSRSLSLVEYRLTADPRHFLWQPRLNLAMPGPNCRFPQPWRLEKTDTSFIIHDANGQALAYVYCEDEPVRASDPSCIFA